MYNNKNKLKSKRRLDKSSAHIEGRTVELIIFIVFLILVELLYVWFALIETGDGINGIDLGFMIFSLNLLVILVLSIQFLFYKVFKQK